MRALALLILLVPAAALAQATLSDDRAACERHHHPAQLMFYNNKPHLQPEHYDDGVWATNCPAVERGYQAQRASVAPRDHGGADTAAKARLGQYQ